MRDIVFIKWIEIAILVSIAFLQDIKSYKVKNKLILVFLCIGIITNVYVNNVHGLIDSLAGIVMPIVILWILFIARVLGAGDIKLFCCIGAIAGAKFTVFTIIYSFLAGGVISLFYIIFRNSAIKSFKSLFNFIKACILTHSILEYEFDLKSKFPFSSAVFLGFLLQVWINI
ncbi:A24 family peptidase [Abyssisolibacter fermentans]|uniref:A24 family peptidase n=1 Tax=Abyssisolibacter fermentans TaxID=1766203 RepID=UPI00082EA911|nr:A24 family peptidase [Abyssisolibacter fermentans]